jgi:hypothetical protein
MIILAFVELWEKRTMNNEEKGIWGFLSYPWMWLMKMTVEIILMPVNWFCYTVGMDPVAIETPFLY